MVRWQRPPKTSEDLQAELARMRAEKSARRAAKGRIPTEAGTGEQSGLVQAELAQMEKPDWGTDTGRRLV